MKTSIRVWQLLAILAGVSSAPVAGQTRQTPGEKEKSRPSSE